MGESFSFKQPPKQSQNFHFWMDNCCLQVSNWDEGNSFNALMAPISELPMRTASQTLRYPSPVHALLFAHKAKVLKKL